MSEKHYFSRSTIYFPRRLEKFDNLKRFHPFTFFLLEKYIYIFSIYVY